MYAIIEDSGTQIRVSAGETVDVDLRELADDATTVTFDKVLMVGDASNDDASTIGTPYVGGASVTAEIVGPVKGEKIDVVKFKRRKGYRRKQGHRQPYLRVKITEINS